MSNNDKLDKIAFHLEGIPYDEMNRAERNIVAVLKDRLYVTDDIIRMVERREDYDGS
jgi:hypothetical protein